MSTTTRRRPNAFTLIEVLTVVAIAALLIAILLPALSLARKQVRSVACRSNMKQLANGGGEVTMTGRKAARAAKEQA